MDLAVGTNTVVVQSRDANDNVATKTYSVTTSGTSKNFEYDAYGNLRYESSPTAPSSANTAGISKTASCAC
ncbi:MAG TPA: hypothetical protein VFQ61_30220 [Polyangiaceae bacterium]|nr:hypothetical protein [Polyangiaceae bacterium]